MVLRRIRAGELTAEQPLPWPLYSQRNNLILSEGSVLASEALEALVDLGLFVEATPLWQRPPHTPLQTVLHATARMAQLLAAPEAQANFTVAIHHVVELIEQASRRNPAVLTATALLHRGGPSAARHAVNTACIVAIVLEAMQASDTSRRGILSAALTMNIGMHELHDALANQSGPLSALQQLIVTRHPTVGADRLAQLGVVDPLWLRAVLEHHEAVDGSGYPQGLRGEQVSAAAQLIGLADLFCARVGERGYRDADDARLVLRDVLIERGRLFDGLQAAWFIRALGVYPIGTVVLLANGEVGVVSAHSGLVDAPWVHVLRARDGSAYEQPLQRETRITEFAIVDTLSPSSLPVEIDLAAIWGDDAADYPLGIPTLLDALPG
ncbi:HD-GYP domain-containing protein [Chitinimonas taiwanensis]|uniref:HD domain-containing protein n=1 Tax=Chitinimonas taiwanensis DSM 18899 TaxID=1121279 RepID=A0A1K2HNI7_9NEIS|nr:HD domain-containing phosphohydrolase [Chitinimonas taiwanensis]SFZ77802.1 HD domain-containing protein [Chitinimonas taiwanensis DSM 18899]